MELENPAPEEPKLQKPPKSTKKIGITISALVAVVLVIGGIFYIKGSQESDEQPPSLNISTSKFQGKLSKDITDVRIMQYL